MQLSIFLKTVQKGYFQDSLVTIHDSVPVEWDLLQSSCGCLTKWLA